MNWYLAKMVFQIICGEGKHRPQFDEQLRLIHAGTKEEAFDKAQELGKREADLFINQQQKLVQWQFAGTSEIFLLSELIDGAEIYSRIEERDDAEQYLHVIHRKAEALRFDNTHELLNIA